MDVFIGQMTSKVKEVLRIKKTTVTSVSANMTRFYQPVDLTVNGRAQKVHCKEV